MPVGEDLLETVFRYVRIVKFNTSLATVTNEWKELPFTCSSFICFLK